MTNQTLQFAAQVTSVTALVFVVILWTRLADIVNKSTSTNNTSTSERIVNDDGKVYMTTKPEDNSLGIEIGVDGDKIMSFRDVNGLQLETGKQLQINEQLQFQDATNNSSDVTYAWPATHPTTAGEVLTASADTAASTTTWSSGSDFQHITYRNTALQAPRILRITRASTPNVDIGITPITVAPAQWNNIEVKTGELVRLSFNILWDNDEAQSASVPFCLLNILRDGSSVSTWKQGVAGTATTGGEYATHNPTYFDVVDPGTYSYSFQLSTTVDNVMIIVTSSGCYGELAVVYMPDVTVNNENWM